MRILVVARRNRYNGLVNRRRSVIGCFNLMYTWLDGSSVWDQNLILLNVILTKSVVKFLNGERKRNIGAMLLQMYLKFLVNGSNDVLYGRHFYKFLKIVFHNECRMNRLMRKGETGFQHFNFVLYIPKCIARGKLHGL